MENVSTAVRQSLSDVSEFAVQQVLLDELGYILESDDKLLSMLPFRQKAIAAVCPFFESIFPSLQLLKEDKEELYLPTIGLYVEDNFQGYFHYTFSKVRYQERIVLLWTIIKDKDAIKRQQLQQIANGRSLLEESFDNNNF